MGMLEFSIPHYYLNAALRGPREHDVDISALLKKSGILEDILDQPMARITASQYAELIQNIWLEMKDEYMGLGVAPSPIGSFAMMCHAVIHCPTIEKALLRAFRFYSLFLPEPLMTLESDDEYAYVKIDETQLNDPDRFLAESLLVIWHRFGSWLIGRRINLVEASFIFSPPDTHNEYQKIFSCDIQFNASYTGLKFPLKFLSEKVTQSETTLRGFLKHSPADLLARPDEGNSLVAQIRRIISDDLSQELPNFEFVANALHTSAQTLRRRLKEEGLTYQELKDQMRRDTALYFLERGDLSIQEVAEKLGFSVLSALEEKTSKWVSKLSQYKGY